jgi:hypothetical protein
MSVEFLDEQESSFSAIVPRAYTYQPRSKMVRILMKAGFKTEKSANIFLIGISVFSLVFAIFTFWGMTRTNSGQAVSWDQIPQEIRDQLPQNIVDQLKK